MFNQPTPIPNFGSFDDHLKRMTRRVQQIDVEDRIAEFLQQAIETEFNKENIMLLRPDWRPSNAEHRL